MADVAPYTTGEERGWEVRVLELRWDWWNLEHIAHHGVAPWEVEEVVTGGPYDVRRSHSGRFAVVGQTDAGRYLSVIVAQEGGGVCYVITARDADNRERQAYQRRYRRR